MTLKAPTWVFDALPPSGARRGGDPSEHVFKHELDTVVREVVQNANDQRVGAPRIDFTARELSGPELSAFQAALQFDALEQHLTAAGKSRLGKRIAARLRELKAGRRLTVLRVEDRNTVDLTGDESEGESHFRALCKDVLFSHKHVASAGGSYGLGKSVLWTFSGLSTVVFNSIPTELPAGKKAPRLIARAELPSHTTAGQPFAGAGWFGVPTAARGGERAESVWSLHAAQAARELGVEREQLDSGTSILILDFREPAADEDAPPKVLESRIREAAVRWFWPAMLFEGRALRVSTQRNQDLDPRFSSEVLPFIRCFDARKSGRDALEEPGDVVARDLELELPARRDGSPARTGRVRLVVRLASEDEASSHTGHVAMFRGAGMVVRYWDRTSLSSRNRPFHAILLAGEARDLEHVDDADRAVEAFLRDAEPPGHDEWESTPGLKETWARGYAKALEQLKTRVTQTLKDLLSPTVTYGSRGPELLMKRFPFGARGTPGSGPAAFHFHDLQARLVEGAWRFKGQLAPAGGRGAWTATVALKELGDDGAVVRGLEVRRLESGRSGARITLHDGVATVTVERGIDALAFEGESEVLARPAEAGALSLEVTGSRG
ncbi:MAG: hypothetical protein JNK82_04040 [Myxococcaceae bacterium]|nr:hypothetical protein [Myxococcaceae bacterium]